MNEKWMPLTLIPLVGGILFFVVQTENYDQLYQKAVRLQEQNQVVEQEKNRESAIRNALKVADKKYLQEQVETVVFLKPEMKRLQALSLHRKDPELLLQRLDFLKSGKNQVAFIEGEHSQKGDVLEIEEKMIHPVELNDEDLKRLLVLLEGVAIDPYVPLEGRPQLIIKNFELSKKKEASDEEVYVMKLDLLKRELL